MNSSMEHVCNPHFVGANAETSEETKKRDAADAIISEEVTKTQ